MAKTTKRGLGRGLGSLLSGTFDADAPVTPSPEKERITINEDDVLYEEEAAPSDASSLTEGTENSKRKEDVQDSDPSENLEVLKDSHKQKESQSSEESKTARETQAVEEQPKSRSIDIEDQEYTSRYVGEVPIDAVVPNPNQPRTNFDKEEIEELSASIKRDGLLQPLLVRALGNGKYQIIAGERRWHACRLAGLKAVPVRIKDIDEDKALELALIENVQRSDLNPIEEAYGYRRLMEHEHMTQADVAQAMSKGRSTVANAMRLLDLPEDAQQLLFENKITAGHARAILSIPTKEGRQALTDKLLETKFSVRETENLARLLSGKNETQTPTRQAIPASYKTVAKALRDALKTNVRVRSAKGKNKIEIEFKDEEELQRLFEDLVASHS